MRKLEKTGRRILPGIWQLNRTTFIVRVQPKDARTGRKQNLRRVLENATRQDAIRVREELLAGVHAPPSTSTLPETVRDFGKWWLEHKRARGDVAESTHDRYTLSLGHVSKRILDAHLDEVTAEMIERWMTTAIAEHADQPRYAVKTVNGWLRVLGTMFGAACRLRGLSRNPVALVRALAEPVDLEERNTLPAADIARVVDELVKGDRCVALAACTQAFTGMRWGEVAALQWRDLDEEERVLEIRRTFSKGKLVPRTKTGRARRTGIPAWLRDLLVSHRAWLEEQRHPGVESGLMFPSSVGNPIWSARISEQLRAACKRAGITQRFTSQGFRRSLTDRLREAAVDPVVAKAITGHSTDRMREHYSTVRAADVREAGDRAAALVVPRLKLIRGGAAEEPTAKESSEESSPADGSETAGEAAASNRP